MSQKEALLVQSRIAKVVSSLPENNQASIQFLNLWSSTQAFTFSRWIPEINTRIIEVHGEILRAPQLTKEGFAFLLCHEFGHQIGGAPFMHPKFLMSTEGQSDYFASLDCVKRYFSLYKGGERSLSPDLLKLCLQTHTELKEQKLCAQVIQAGENFLNTLIFFEKTKKHISFLRKSPFHVKKTISGFDYPSYQCRLDTVVAGALCNKPPSLNKTLSSCPFVEGAQRPRCWFKKDKEL